MVTYTFVARNPGTFSYFSATRMDLEVEMGLIGALVVRPKQGVVDGNGNTCVLPALPSTQALFAPTIGSSPGVVYAAIPATLPLTVNGITTQASTLSASRGFAYCTIDAYYDHEYLFLVTEMDPELHRMVEFGQMAQVDHTKRHPAAWFINGRNYPDTQLEAYVPWLPNQPYNALPLAHPGENFLIRFVGGGSDLHPMHAHGANHNVIARDGQLLQSPAGVLSRRADLPISDYTTTTVAGETVDALWGPWTGAKLYWDIYGHANSVDENGIYPATCTARPAPAEYLADHCRPFPVKFPAQSKLAYGQMWGGTPFMGLPGAIPEIDPITGQYHSDQNPMAAQTFMFHSHNEREITTNNIFIGGAATMTMVMPYTDMDGNLIVIP
jgi:manganese oxidase